MSHPTRLRCSVLILGVLVLGAVCPPRFLRAFTDAVPTQEQMDELARATKSITPIRDAAFRQALDRFANDIVDAFENPVPGIPEPGFNRTLAKLAHVLAGPADGRYTAAHLRSAIIAVDGLRDNGVLFAGLVERAGTPFSSAWLTTASNRGHLFEVIAAKGLIDRGVVPASSVRGFGFRLASQLEGDFVVSVAGGGEHWFDFKAAGGEATLLQIQRAEQALTSGEVSQFTFAYETGQDPRSAEAVRLAIEAANDRLAEVRSGLRIEFLDVGGNQ